MKKLVSAVTSLCMAATMIGSVVPAVTSAADAKKGFSIKAYADSDSKYASEGSKVTVSKEDIAAGDVTVPCAIYLSENTPDTEAFSVQLTVILRTETQAALSSRVMKQVQTTSRITRSSQLLLVQSAQRSSCLSQALLTAEAFTSRLAVHLFFL